jgi:UDP-glucose 4-epimerase
LIRNKKIFITGGAGFIASAFIRRIVEYNQVVAFDNLDRNTLKDMPFADHPNLTLTVGDVVDSRHLLKTIPEDTDIVIHCAAIAGIEAALRKPVETIRVNMLGSANLLEAATHLQNCQRVVCFSTSEVYGRQAIRPKEADDSVIGAAGKSHWTYAASKLVEEHLAIAYYQENGLPTTVLRPFNVYGPGQVGDGAIRAFIIAALKNQPLKVHEDGTQIRAWCYVEDMIDALALAIQNPRAVGETFNIGNPKETISILGLVRTIIRVLNSDSVIEFIENDLTDVDLRIPAVEKAYEILGFEAKVDLEEGIRRTAEFYRRFLTDNPDAK